MPNFGAEYNTILNNLATLYDLRQEKIEVVKINKRIDQVSSLIKHPLVQDVDGVIYKYVAESNTYVPISVLAESGALPTASDYPAGTLVMYNDVLYINNSNGWNAVELSQRINQIGVAGQPGFGVGIAPLVPSGMQPMEGYKNPLSDNYGNYVWSADGSVMVWIPRFYVKVTHDGTTNINKIEVRGTDTYPTPENASADGFVIHRMFIDGGVVKDGVFVDKYSWSLTNFSNGVSGIASSVRYGNPISSSVDTNRDGSNLFAGSFADCISNSQTPSDSYGGAWAAAKSRGNDFAVWSIFIAKGLALLALAHGQASTSTTNCAWYHATNNFPKGNNNYGADINDATCTFTAATDAYWSARNEARKCGSANTLAKVTHNGQNCGVADLNGNQWGVVQGLTAICASKTITNAVHDAGVVTITATAHGYTSNQQVLITGVVGMTDLNDKIHTVTVTDENTFTVPLTTAQTYTSGGSATRGTFYLLKESVALKSVTGGNSGANDHFADAYITANMDAVTVPFKNGSIYQSLGNSTNRVLPFSTTRTSNDYRKLVAGLPDADTSLGGSNQFGADYYIEYFRDELCPLVGGGWSNSTAAGVWALSLDTYRTSAYRSVAARSCLYV